MEHRTFKDLTQLIESMCRHGGSFVRADDPWMRQLGFVSERDESRFMLPIIHVGPPNGALPRFLGFTTPEGRDAFAAEVSKDPEALLAKVMAWFAAQDVI